MIYVIGPIGGPYKIGMTENIEVRLRTLQTGHWEPLLLHLECTSLYDDSTLAEILKDKLAAFHVELGGGTEWWECDFERVRYQLVFALRGIEVARRREIWRRDMKPFLPLRDGDIQAQVWLYDPPSRASRTHGYIMSLGARDEDNWGINLVVPANGREIMDVIRSAPPGSTMRELFGKQRR